MNTNNLLLTVLLLCNTLNLFAQAKTASISYLFPGHDHPEEVVVEIKDGFLILEGDIIIGEEKHLHQKAATLSSTSRLWPNGTIPYVIQADHPGAEGILDAIQHVNESTNLCLIEYSTETDYVEFINGTSCASSIGKTGGRQSIVASRYCGFGSFVHEILHAAGVYHEQSRADRDDFVTIHFDEMNQSYRGNFNKYYSGQDVGSYDYGSIMHYHSRAFSSTGNPTITINEAQAPEGTTIGQRNALSSGDIVGVNTIYPAASSCGSSNLSCEDSGILTEIEDILQWDGISITNTGTQTTPPVMVDLYFSKNAVISTSDVYLGSVQIPSINKGKSHQFDEQLDKESIESLANEDRYYLGFIIDSQDELVESDENDNNDCAESSESIETSALPVTLIDFSVQRKGNKGTELTWEVSEEYALDYYQVQYSEDTKEWEDRVKISAENNTTGQYRALDLPSKIPTKGQNVYYRLKMVDNDGTERFSSIRYLRIQEEDTELKVFPNPSNGSFEINLPHFNGEEYEVQVTNLAGQIVHREIANEGNVGINLETLESGNYWLIIITPKEVTTQKIVLVAQ